MRMSLGPTTGAPGCPCRGHRARHRSRRAGEEVATHSEANSPYHPSPGRSHTRRLEHVTPNDEGTMIEKSRRGFASMSPERQREITSKGGRAAHEKGTAHEWSRDEARNAGHKGGVVVSRNRDHMSAIGREGGEARGRLTAQARGDRRFLECSSDLSVGHEVDVQEHRMVLGDASAEQTATAEFHHPPDRR